jgi:hypothetical protein
MHRWFSRSSRTGKSNTGALASASSDASKVVRQLPSELLWLLDAPLFIDSKQVDAFYDAILRPDYEAVSETLSNSLTTGTKVGAGTTVGAALPWFAKAELAANLSRSHATGRDYSATISPISNSHRHLLALALHYATRGDGRLAIANLRSSTASSPGSSSLPVQWLTPEFIDEVPRALVFLDVPVGTKLIPAALELTGGTVKVLTDKLAKELGSTESPGYPGSTASRAKKDAFFRWFDAHDLDRAALKVVEEEVGESKIAWIAFNSVLSGLPRTSDEPSFIHLNLSGRGEYETGVFGYNMIVRGHNHGLRIVGTLKSGPDLNVLAVFER